ncbi:hypothetical protein F9Z84_07080 [Escherichia coli]|nr:hypothetical protein F9Z84_07080 [Escherichia coli]
MEQKNFQRRPQTMVNDFRYPMPKSDKPVDGAKYPATWFWDIGLNGAIYFKVNDGHYGQDDKNAKSKEVELSVFDRNALFELIENAIRDTNFTKAQYHVKKITFGAGGRLNDHASTLGTFTVIRDQEGRIAVGYSKGTYKVMFPFTSPYESTILVSNGGEPYEDRGLMSRVYAKAFIDFSRKFLDQAEWDAYKPREKKENGGNGGNRGNGGGNNWNNGGGNRNNNGGGNNWNSNNGGGNRNQSAPTDFDDDIEF